jgi:hypothetical protein
MLLYLGNRWAYLRRRRAITIGGFGVEERLKERRIHEGADVEVYLRSRDPYTRFDVGVYRCVPVKFSQSGVSE